MQDPYNNGNNSNRFPPSAPVRSGGDSMATAAMVMGILALATFIMMTIYLPLIFGGIGIVLALLSKGSAAKMAGRARIGLICSTAGLIAGYALLAAGIYVLCTNPDIMNQINELYRQQFGMSYEEIMNLLLNGASQP